MFDSPHSDAQSGGLTGPESGILATFKRALSSLDAARRRFLAATRLSLGAVCRESAGLGGYDYHNYADDVDNAPWHIEGGARCRRCGKNFRL